MTRRLLLVSVQMVGAWASATMAAVPDKVTYQDHVQPIFRNHCGKCHNPQEKNSDLDIMTFPGLVQGGASGAVVVGGDPDGSRLVKLLAHLEEPKMPPESPKIPDAEIELVKAWVAGGLLEKSDSKAMLSAKPKKALALASTSFEKPQGPIAYPVDMLIEPFVRHERGSAISCIAASPWAPVVAIAGPKAVLVYNSDTFDLLGILPFPEGLPHVVKFSRNGSLLLVGGGRGGHSGKVVLFDVSTGERIATIGDEYDVVLAADISSDQQMVALGGRGKLVRIHSTKTGEIIHSIKKHTDWVTAIEFSPDSVLVASGDRAGGLHVWESFSGQLFYSLNGHKGAITDVTWRADSNLVAASSEDTTVSMWEMFNGTQVKNFAAHAGGVLSAEFAKDGRLATAGRDNTVKLWDGNGGGLRTFEAFGDLATATTFTHDAARVVGGDWTGDIRVWKTDDGARLANLPLAPPTIAERITATDSKIAELQPKTDEVVKANEAAAAAQQQAQTSADAAKKVLVDAQAVMVAADKALADARAIVQTTGTQINDARAAVEARRNESKARADAVAAEKTALEQAQAALAIADKSIALQGPLAQQLTSLSAAAKQASQGVLNGPKVEEAAKLLDQALAAANEALAGSQAEQKAKSEEIAKRTNTIRDAASAAAASVDQVNAAEKTVSDLTAALQSAEASVASNGTAATDAKTKVDAAAKAAAVADQALASASQAAANAKAASDAALAALNQAKQERQKWEVAKVRVTLHQARDVAAQHEAKHAELAARSAESKAVADAVAAEMAAAEKTLVDGPTAVEGARASIVAAQTAIDSANTQLDASRTQLAKKEALRADFEAQMASIKKSADAEPGNQVLAGALAKANETLGLLVADRDAASKDVEAKQGGVSQAVDAKKAAEDALVATEKMLAELPAKIEAFKSKHAELAAVAGQHQAETQAALAEVEKAKASVDQIGQQIASLGAPLQGTSP